MRRRRNNYNLDVIPEELAIREMPRDGHCFYNSICVHEDINYTMPELRTVVSEYLRREADRFRPFYPEDDEDIIWSYDEYVNMVADVEARVWAGEIELSATEEILSREIIVVDADNGGIYERQYAIQDPTKQPIFILFSRNDTHYDALFHEDEVHTIINNIRSTNPPLPGIVHKKCYSNKERELDEDISILLDNFASNPRIPIYQKNDGGQVTGSSPQIKKEFRVLSKEEKAALLEAVDHIKKRAEKNHYSIPVLEGLELTILRLGMIANPDVARWRVSFAKLAMDLFCNIELGNDTRSKSRVFRESIKLLPRGINLDANRFQNTEIQEQIFYSIISAIADCLLHSNIPWHDETDRTYLNSLLRDSINAVIATLDALYQRGVSVLHSSYNIYDAHKPSSSELYKREIGYSYALFFDALLLPTILLFEKYPLIRNQPNPFLEAWFHTFQEKMIEFHECTPESLSNNHENKQCYDCCKPTQSFSRQEANGSNSLPKNRTTAFPLEPMQAISHNLRTSENRKITEQSQRLIKARSLFRDTKKPNTHFKYGLSMLGKSKINKKQLAILIARILYDRRFFLAQYDEIFIQEHITPSEEEYRKPLSNRRRRWAERAVDFFIESPNFSDNIFAERAFQFMRILANNDLHEDSIKIDNTGVFTKQDADTLSLDTLPHELRKSFINRARLSAWSTGLILLPAIFSSLGHGAVASSEMFKLFGLAGWLDYDDMLQYNYLIWLSVIVFCYKQLPFEEYQNIEYIQTAYSRKRYTKYDTYSKQIAKSFSQYPFTSTIFLFGAASQWAIIFNSMNELQSVETQYGLIIPTVTWMSYVVASVNAFQFYVIEARNGQSTFGDFLSKLFNPESHYLHHKLKSETGKICSSKKLKTYSNIILTNIISIASSFSIAALAYNGLNASYNTLNDLEETPRYFRIIAFMLSGLYFFSDYALHGQEFREFNYTHSSKRTNKYLCKDILRKILYYIYALVSIFGTWSVIQSSGLMAFSSNQVSHEEENIHLPYSKNRLLWIGVLCLSISRAIVSLRVDIKSTVNATDKYKTIFRSTHSLSLRENAVISATQFILVFAARLSMYTLRSDSSTLSGFSSFLFAAFINDRLLSLRDKKVRKVTKTFEIQHLSNIFFRISQAAIVIWSSNLIQCALEKNGEYTLNEAFLLSLATASLSLSALGLSELIRWACWILFSPCKSYCTLEDSKGCCSTRNGSFFAKSAIVEGKTSLPKSSYSSDYSDDNPGQHLINSSRNRTQYQKRAYGSIT